MFYVIRIDTFFKVWKKVVKICYCKCTSKNKNEIDATYNTTYNRKKKSNPITITKHGTIKKIYVKMVKEVIESEESNEKD